MNKSTLTIDEVERIAKLANLTLQFGQAENFAEQFSATISVVNELSQVDTSDISLTYQVNNLLNITREDEIDLTRVLPQEVAIREAKKTHGGYIVVDRVIDNN